MGDLAIFYVVEHCALGWRRIICESNSQVAVTVITRKQPEGVNWNSTLVIRQFLHLCSSLDSITFVHIPREWNCIMKWASNQM